ncbi:hypothetical protein CHGG_01845 [Chaetomium globosum CBS 148.51]|uniref:RING-type E3 ubiquitin transferase n=1 Tax=Chaetomium globosum (strain ATCC 6205 / CBS 148.51 / DSM 1962 / NBRC 6347 / NRRL 1970) TaxID=306901 RepID=Q2HD59_CHAGB|nr:uncharacterized protein CHGG_01845 [Chaetomium globosum CBS 148.51]EAQ93610.1 hypothetical protein CHGG_01845 [Chaetomium globosum CBS 148.51]
MASQPPPSRPPPPLTSSPYPFAAAPDIIRAHQKDAYFQGVLTNQLSDLHRRLRGARSAHAWATETRTFADALYLCLTTLIGNRTLGEEYCDLIQVEAPASSSPQQQQPHQTPETTTAPTPPTGPLLPSLPLRAGYITTSILLPYLASRTLPRLRATLRTRLQTRLATLTRQGRDEARDKSGRPGAEYRAVRYLLAHLGELTSGAHVQAVVLAVFYFTGAYYSLSKRVWGLRYVFTRRVEEEVGAGGAGAGGWRWCGRGRSLGRRAAFGPGADVDVSLDENAFTSNNELLGGGGVGGAGSAQRTLGQIGAMAHTPVPRAGRARYDLASEKVMGWIKGEQQRKCTLCLEELKDPAATQCGHVFCWACDAGVM